MDENSLVVSLHKFTGCSIDECHKALSLAMRYLKLRHPIGDHPEEASKHEYELVPKDYITKSEQWLKELTEYKQLNKPCVAHQVCHEDKVKAIDKIRAEIDGAKLPKNRMCFFRDGIECALQIIDKYKVESEDKE